MVSFKWKKNFTEFVANNVTNDKFRFVITSGLSSRADLKFSLVLPEHCKDPILTFLPHKQFFWKIKSTFKKSIFSARAPLQV